MATTLNTRSIGANAQWAAAGNHDRRGVTEHDRLARRLRERQLFARYRGRNARCAAGDVDPRCVADGRKRLA